MANAAAQLLQAVYGGPSAELSSVAASQPLPDILATILASNPTSESDATGGNAEGQTEVLSFVSKAGHVNGLSSPAELAALDAHLLTRTYLVANRRTAADVAVLGALHPWLTTASTEERLQYPSVTRHLDLLQHDEAVTKAALLKTVEVDVDHVPKATRAPAASNAAKATAKAGKGDAPAAAGAAKPGKGEAAAKGAAAIPEGAPTAKKEKKAKGGDGKGGGDKPPAGAGDGAPRPSHIDMRVGKIVDVKKHPDADSLYVEQIDLGEPEGPRTVVSGLVKYIPIEEMQGRSLVAICNLKPAAMRGIKSYAMVLAATSKDGKEGPGSVELVGVPEGSQPGDRVFFEGCENELPLEQLPPKKKIFETIQPGLTTLESREAAWRDPADPSRVLRIVTKRGPCVAPSFVGASLS